MQHKDPEELYARCHIFGVKFHCVRRPTPGPSAERHRLDLWIHQLWTVHPKTGGLLRQEHIEGLDDKSWRDVIQRLTQVRPQELW